MADKKIVLDKANSAALVNAQGLHTFLSSKADGYTNASKDSKTPPAESRELFRKAVGAENASKVLKSVMDRLEAGFFA